ncbi:cytochrome P450 [Peniophora sp. CONT]|nr:cytochrome P450 [Peniophora sp. CONT]
MGSFFVLSLTLALTLSVYCLIPRWVRNKRENVRGLRNIPGPPNISFFTGHLAQMFGPSASGFRSQISRRYGRVIRVRGILSEEQLFVADTRALRSILVDESALYSYQDFFVALSSITHGPGLLSTNGDRHKSQRRLVDSVFNSANVRRAFPLFQDVTHKFSELMDTQIENHSDLIMNMLPLLGKFSLEAIGIVGFGHSFHALDNDMDEFVLALENHFPMVTKVQHLAPLLPVLMRFIPTSTLRRIGEFLPWETMHQLFNISDIHYRHSTCILGELKGIADEFHDPASNHKSGKSLMASLVQANTTANPVDRVPDLEIIAHISTFLLAGTDTTGSTLSRILHLLSEHPQMQERLRDELAITTELDHDTLMGLPLLDAIIRETLRVYPAVRLITRQAAANSILPLGKPVVGIDGQVVHSIFVPEGTTIILDLAGANTDEDLWGEDAKTWRPERWLDGVPSNVIDGHIPSIYSHLMNFSAGPKSCVGWRFALVLIKIVVAHLVSRYTFTPSGHEISWIDAVVTSPTVKGGERPMLPLRVAPVSTDF